MGLSGSLLHFQVLAVFSQLSHCLRVPGIGPCKGDTSASGSVSGACLRFRVFVRLGVQPCVLRSFTIHTRAWGSLQAVQVLSSTELRHPKCRGGINPNAQHDRFLTEHCAKPAVGVLPCTSAEFWHTDGAPLLKPLFDSWADQASKKHGLSLPYTKAKALDSSSQFQESKGHQHVEQPESGYNHPEVDSMLVP